jgi:DNA primase
MRSKITERCINEIQDHLKDYVMEHSSKSKNRKFTCFNKSAHSHKDEDPSASIVPGSRGRYWNCFSCGAKGNILTAVQYKEGIEGFHYGVKFLSAKYNIDIETADPVTDTKRGFEPKQNMDISCASNKNNATYKVKQDDFKNSGKKDKFNFRKDVTANYYYQDELGNIVYKICRREWMDNGKRKKDFMAYTKVNSSWSFGIKGTRHVIYKLPEVLEGIKNDKTIFFVEGEKCADEIFKLGQVATTTAFGARGFSAYSADYVASLSGANIVILPDNDESGKAYAKDVLNAIKNQAKSIKIVELPDLKLKTS